MLVLLDPNHHSTASKVFGAPAPGNVLDAEGSRTHDRDFAALPCCLQDFDRDLFSRFVAADRLLEHRQRLDGLPSDCNQDIILLNPRFAGRTPRARTNHPQPRPGLDGASVDPGHAQPSPERKRAPADPQTARGTGAAALQALLLQLVHHDVGQQSGNLSSQSSMGTHVFPGQISGVVWAENLDRIGRTEGELRENGVTDGRLIEQGVQSEQGGRC